MPRTETEPIAAPAARDYLTIAQVAARLKVSPQAVNAWINNGRISNGKTVLLKSVRVVGQHRIAIADLTKFLAHWN